MHPLSENSRKVSVIGIRSLIDLHTRFFFRQAVYKVCINLQIFWYPFNFKRTTKQYNRENELILKDRHNTLVYRSVLFPPFGILCIDCAGKQFKEQKTNLQRRV